MIVIVDYGMGNLGSILNMLRRLKEPAVISADPETVGRADKIILPGVGSFDAGMKRLQSAGLINVLESRVIRDRIPLLGICLGMQLLTRRSEEGTERGLGWIDAEALRFSATPAKPALRVPHMGWNVVRRQRVSPLTGGMEESERFYFVHSYYIQCAEPRDIVLTADYGVTFVAGFQRDNLYGVQFHPEKSHKFGMRLLQRFCTG